MFWQLYDVLLSGVFFGSFAAVAAVLMSPLQFLKVIKQQTGESYSKIATDTFRTEGVAAFFRGALPYAIMNFLSSMSFGISEVIADNLLKFFVHSTLFAVFFRSVFGGCCETLCSLPSEMREISRNKGSLMESRATFGSVMLPILFRNMIFWSASVTSYEISVAYHFNLLCTTFTGFSFGVLAAFLSIPLDVVATRDCGALTNRGIFGHLTAILSGEERINYLLRGTSIRIVQVAMFTLVTVLTMFLFEAVFIM
ncbi:hypothetical protein NHE_0885 [Neorickettsia helminthoeca str. Oregon]|uniref:Uncharacterized protein n=1 Tax=Neorickettsia helminthoeca str. Oregon TaxID=1286528 RepID=X5HL23_9RICK|nr:MC/SLC25 family protein [Neorickettsia helminthoeca]AHX11804.1 hypothetical protein NHE_0885 [Neorickettsia helminthoeca str. Oregon]